MTLTQDSPSGKDAKTIDPQRKTRSALSRRAKRKTAQAVTPDQVPALAVPVGSVIYRLRLIHGHVPFQGESVLGTVNFDTCEIEIADVVTLDKRLKTFWHELAHAWDAELNVHDRALEGESLANLIALGMAQLGLKHIKAIEKYLSSPTGQTEAPPLSITTEVDR